jgi:hypothetical protein
VEQRKRVFFKWLVLGKGGVDDVGREPADSSDNAVSVAMAHWNVEQCVFAVEQFSRNSDSIVTVQRPFRRKFNVDRRGAIPVPNTILRLVEAFRTAGSFVKKSQLCRKKMLGREMQDFEERLRMFVRQEGRHLTDIFRT